MTSKRQQTKKTPPARVTLDPERMSSVLATRRKELGWSLRELADRSGVSSSAVHSLEQGNTRVQLDNFVLVLAALDLRPDEVLVVDSEATVRERSVLEREIDAIRGLTNPEEILKRLAAILERSESS